MESTWILDRGGGGVGTRSKMTRSTAPFTVADEIPPRELCSRGGGGFRVAGFPINVKVKGKGLTRDSHPSFNCE